MQLDKSVIVLTADAKMDLKQAFNYYYSIDQTLADKFIITINNYFEKIKTTPTAAATQYDTIRVKAILSFPFTIHYTILPNQILIIRIFNTHQKPFW
jgi:plasmid stabilization system protein ParE